MDMFRIFKKLCAIAALTVLALAVYGGIGFAETHGTLRSGLSWVLSDSGTLTISGQGEMPGGDTTFARNAAIKQIIIEDGVTRVCFQKHKPKRKAREYAVRRIKPKGKQGVDVEYNS